MLTGDNDGHGSASRMVRDKLQELAAMAHLKILISGVTQVESDLTFFRKRASEERTAALHARGSEARTKHNEKAQQYEARVRAIAMREQHLLQPSF